MNFGEIIARSQSRCTEVLLEIICQKKSEGHEVIVEPAPRLPSGEVAFAPDGLKLPLRYDLVFKDSSGKYHNENANSVTFSFSEPVFATWERSLKIEILSLCWDFMRFDLSPSPTAPDWESVRAWFLKWFDVEDKKIQPNGLMGVVHFISDPVLNGSSILIFTDLGSANSDALAELFDEFVRLGFTSCVIGKKD